MLPSILAKQLQQGVRDYIETTFPMTNAPFAGSLSSMFDRHDAVYHEPYISVKLPFRKVELMPEFFEGVELPFLPYVHQQKAYERLTGDAGRSTLVATGTGSGKTECFLNPILEYCYQHQGEPGIKALIIYPMNALATDQAGRIAKAIYASPKLREAGITAGMYIGGGRGKGSTMMSEPNKEENVLGVITDHGTMINQAPDILLTNYKMLDYLLVRPKDAGLWHDNNPETLKYIVVDEFHTFDGAQGTDLACLLRRLKARLYTPMGYLCCVGTSATMGDKASDKDIRQYASEVFGEVFDDESVITEDRLTPEEFFAGIERKSVQLPSTEDVQELVKLSDMDDEIEYLRAAARYWFPEFRFSFGENVLSERLVLGDALKTHGFFQDVITVMKGSYWQCSGLYEELRNRYPIMESWLDKDAGLNSLFALVSYARTGSVEHPMPFLFVQVQFWMRELRRLMGRVSDQNIDYMLAPDLNAQQTKAYLPVVNCRDCGATGWAAVEDEQHHAVIKNLEGFYNLYFNASDKIVLMYPGNPDHGSQDLRPAKLCPNCHHLSFADDLATHCPEDNGEYIDVLVPRIKTSGSKRHRQIECPFCGSRRGISLMGLRSTTEISASISQMMASRFNDDKKTLTFSDSVQDAAYRAGFFNSRTWRFGLRGAIQHFIETKKIHHQNLVKFVHEFLNFYENSMSRETFVSYFIPPNMTWMRAYQELRENRQFGEDKTAEDLLHDIRCRLGYEIMLEYGVTSRIGRTLEKSGCSCLTFDREEIDVLAEAVQEHVINELGVMASSSILDFQRMVFGWLTVLRQNGAFDDKVFYHYCAESGHPYLLSNDYVRWMPGLQSGRNTPRFLCDWDGQGKRPYYFDTTRNWKYTSVIESCMETDDLMREDLADQISSIILLEAVKICILREMSSKDSHVKIYGLNKEHVYISDDVLSFTCDNCKNEAAFSREFADVMEGASCARRNCGGYLQINEKGNLGYYGRLYRSGDLVRIHAYEHTGLLAREDRERIENNFKRSEKEQRQDWDPNVLSCTPTLEMGIDIGDLSSVILCSMPPAQAQFFQRVGRAGRTDGNSLVIVVANARPHDLYFYTEPLDMMQGTVATPHIFLKASAVLQRQFMAFCMDNWIKNGTGEAAIPKHLGQAVINVKKGTSDTFPHNYLNYVQKRKAQLFQMFTRLFENELDSQAKRELEIFAKGKGLSDPPLQNRVLEIFREMAEEIDSINENIKTLNVLQKEYEAKPKDASYDEEIKTLKYEKMALLNVKKNLKNKDIFNFLSDEGLLPNYAFPEEGITLRAVLFRKTDENVKIESALKKGKYQNTIYEYNRAASSAISEFAPNNSFYAGGHHFTIDQVDMNSSKPELWRLCPNCAHAEPESTLKNRAACPHCGSPMWADAGQVREMLKVKMVYSNMDMSKSLIDDGSDSREVKFYTKQLLVDVDEDQDIVSAYSMNNDEFPFGYEFVRKAVLREINFGEADISKTEEMIVNGIEEARKGFHVCKYCGRIRNDEGKINHAPYCKTRKNEALVKDAEEECLFLYREFSTEVLRILIPETTAVGTRMKTESFTAAFMLGMKEYFGNVDHLRATVSEVPVKNADYRKQYLVIYDSVPGGTGYLKQLMQHNDALTTVLEKALKVLEDCKCKDDPKKDGCYHCLYEYRQSRNIGDISRRVAIKLLRTILSGKDRIEKIDKLDSVKTNHLFDSELEQQFIVALGQMGNEHRKVEIQQVLVHDKQGYILNITEEDAAHHIFERYSWEIEPQVLLDQEQGVSIKCKPDFVLWPNFDTSNGQHLPVAVFTDGFLYHKNKVADDTLKREAIHRSGNFRVWSLSYKDVQSVFQVQDDFATNALEESRMLSGQQMYSLMVKNKNATSLQPSRSTMMELLMQYLGLCDAEDQFRGQADAYAMSLSDKSKATVALEFNRWNQKIKTIVEDSHFTDINFDFGKTIFGWWRPRSSQSDLSCLMGMDIGRYKKNPVDAVMVVSILDDRPDRRGDKYEQEWNGFWHFHNVMQFMDNFIGVSELGIQDKVYLALPISDSVSDGNVMDDGMASPWDKVIEKLKEYADEQEMRLLMSMREQGVDLPDIVADDVQDGDTVLDGVELAWSNRKLAFIISDCKESRDNFEKEGWTVFDETVEDINEYFGGDKA